MRRILLVLSVAALMVAMMVAMAMPAFANARGDHDWTWGESDQDKICHTVDKFFGVSQGQCTRLLW